MTDATETTVTTTVETLDNMIATAEAKRTVAEQAQIEYEASLQAIAEAHGSTYTFNGQVFQIRHREDSKQGRPITYLCLLKAEPKTWLVGRKKAAPAADATPAATDSSAVSETGGATVID